MRRIAVVIPTYSNVVMLKRLLDSIAKHETKHSLYVVVVDNGSDGSMKSMLANWQEFGANRFVVRPKENLGYGGGANAGMEYARASFGEMDYLILNDDMELRLRCIDNLAATLDRNDNAGIVGGKLFYKNGIIQHAGAFLNEQYVGYHYGQLRKPSDYADVTRDKVMQGFEFVTGAMLLIRGEVFKIVGGFDTSFGLGYYEDVDLCWRVNDAGWEVIYNPSAEAIHYEGQTSGKMGEARNELLRRNRNIFIEKHAVPDWDEGVI